MRTIYDQHGYPITTVAEMGEELTKMTYPEAMEALQILDRGLDARAGIFAGEDAEWAGIDTGMGDAERDALDWESVHRAAQLSYRYWIHNPLIRRGVETITQYVFGRGFTITARDESVRKAAREMWANPDVQRQMSGTKGIHRHCSLGQVHGNLFFALHKEGPTKVRRYEMSQIHRVLLDRWGEPAMWLTTYRDPLEGNEGQPIREWVKSIHFADRDISLPSGEQEETISEQYYMHHMPFGSLIGPLGLPTFWPGLAWAKAYKEFLEDFAVISRAYRTFAWKVTGSNFDSLSSARTMLSDGFQRSDRSAFGVGQGVPIPNGQSDLSPIRTSNYTTPADGGRRLALMCMAAFGLPETYFGDVSVGTYATASTVERPVELMMRHMQEMWAREIETQLSFLIDGDPENQKEITVTFPPILEHKALEMIQALQAAGQLEWQALLPKDMATQAMLSLGIQDIEDRIEQMEEAGYFQATRQEQTMELQQKYAPDPQPGGSGGGGGSPSARELGKNYPRTDRPKGRGLPRPSGGVI